MSAITSNLIPDVTAERADELFERHRLDIFKRTDRLFAYLLVAQWIAGIVAAYWIAPRTWEGETFRTHIHVYAAIGLGFLIIIMPLILARLYPGETITRHTIAVAQMLFSALLIHLTGGRIETHFHVFGSLAFLAVYRDWRVLITGSLVVAIDHFLRGVFWPQSVYGVLSGVQWRWLEHVGWVLFEDLFLIVALRQSLVEMRAMAERQAVIEKAKDSIAAANQAKNAFLAHISHEIRTPMTAILGYADLIDQSAQTPQERTESVQTIRRNGEHLLSVLNDILDISKIEAGRLKIDSEPCSPVQIVNDVMLLMRHRAGEKQLHLDAVYETPIPETIQTDATRLRQILMNLLSNAIKFTERGEVRLAVSMAPQNNGDAPRIVFTVHDTGMGLTEQQQAQLFQPFMQADHTTSRRFGGTGLGLAICKRLSETLGGSISVKSESGKGSSFTVSIATGALEGVSMIDPQRELVAQAPPAPRPALIPVQNGGRVLLADDSHDNRRLLQRLLKMAGLEVEAVENGKQALDHALAAINGDAFHVVLMDMQMPEMDGYEATAALRRAGYRGHIIALTAHASDQDRQRCLDCGCDDHVSKPYDVQQLVRSIAAHIQASRDQASAREAAVVT